MASRRNKIVVLSPTPPSVEDDPASQQLLQESRMGGVASKEYDSTSPDAEEEDQSQSGSDEEEDVREQERISAVRSATLLNAARVAAQRTSKLKRPSVSLTQQQKRPAKPDEEDIYEFQVSSDEDSSSSASSEIAAPAPSGRTKRASEASTAARSKILAHVEKSPRHSSRLSGQKVDISGIEWSEVPGRKRKAAAMEAREIPESPPAKRVSTSSPEALLRGKPTRGTANRRAEIRVNKRDRPTITKGLQSGLDGHDEETDEVRPTTEDHQEREEKIPPKRTTGSARKAAQEAKGNRGTRKSGPKETARLPVRSKENASGRQRAQSNSGRVRTSRAQRPRKEVVEETEREEEEAEGDQSEEVDNESIQDEDFAVERRGQRAGVRKPVEEALVEFDDSSEDEGSAQSEDEDSEVDYDAPSATNLRAIFKFIRNSAKRGRCQTPEGEAVHEACRQARAVFVEDAAASADIRNEFQKVRTAIRKFVDESEGSPRINLKRDAFAYLFRSLTLVFKSVYKWALRNYPVPPYTESPLSPEALPLLLMVVRAILQFKESVYAWKVPAPTHGGDPVIRSVNSGLIKPLRLLQAEYVKKRDIYERQVRFENKEAEMEAAYASQREQEERWHRIQATTRERRDLWHKLHVWRMICEPDVFRRSHLQYTHFPDVNEVDANGAPFERLEVFGARHGPPSRLNSSVDGPEWTEEEDTALLEGLEEYSGPLVFKKIFRAYCVPPGPLRRFNVREITSQAAYLRAKILDIHQEDGTEPPQWVRDIPVVP